MNRNKELIINYRQKKEQHMTLKRDEDDRVASIKSKFKFIINQKHRKQE